MKKSAAGKAFAKVKLKSISKLKHEADRVFSLWIRARDKKCVTCGNQEHLQNGHYESRSYNSTRYDEQNCSAQCVGCNVFKRGNMPEYALYLQRKYGQQILELLHAKARLTKQWTRAELQEIIEKYSVKSGD